MKIEWKDCLKIGGSIFLLYLAINYWKTAANMVVAVLGAAAPLTIGAIIAYMVNILMAGYERRYFPGNDKPIVVKSRRPVCMLLAFLTLVAVVVLVVWLVVPQLASCVAVIFAGIPDVARRAVAFAQEQNLFSEETLLYLQEIDWESKISGIISFLGNGIGDVLDIVITTVSSVFDFVVTTLISIIFAVYILANKETLGKQLDRISHRYLSDKVCSTIDYALDVLNHCFRRYVVGQCTEAVILGALCTIGMWIFKFPYAVMVGTLVAFTALIPIAGAYIGAAVGAFMILTVDPWKAVMFLVFLIILQQLEGNLIYPKVVGSSMGLPGIWVLASVTIGGGIMGIPGMLLGVPLAATAYRIIRDDVHKYELLNAPEAEPEIETE